MKYSIVLGVETTCDDTGIGICKNGKVIANQIISSRTYHQNYGGVVPEIAAREHEKNLPLVYKAAIKEANLSANDIDLITYASEPGLPGSLHVGKIFAKTLGLMLKIPMLPINHLYGHLFSGAINQNPIEYPALGLVVSGGHTSIYLINSAFDIQLLDETMDDAIGEVYDKVARELSYDYPGGCTIDQQFDLKQANTINFLKNKRPHTAFSYSGFKTAVINYINHQKQKHTALDHTKVCSSFQYWIIEDFLKRASFYLAKYPVKTVALGGGVSANSYLRSRLQAMHVNVVLPQNMYTEDNAAMHAYYASVLLKEAHEKKFSLPIQTF